ncbi:FKBP-type peptidyl-prolyl cis-trans isomerase [Granulicella rosea]|nr:FKBP-type peptidyl-prolyl cis-trans isomerase [Granulicella rosea]
MKPSAGLLLLSFAVPALAQTAATAPHVKSTTTPVHKAATAAAPAACAKLPELSTKIPALPAGTPCAKPLYTITTQPTVKLEYISPVADPGLKEALGLESTSFSLLYQDTKVGTGIAAAGYKYYTLHYSGYLLDGTKFDSSLDRGEPISIPYGEHQVIPGWDTGFGGMKVGGKRRLIIPFQLAYGTTAHGPIPAKSTLVFDVELVSVSNTPPAPKTPPAPPAGSTPPPAAGAAPAKPAMTPPPAATPAPAAAPATPPATSAKP